MWSLAVAGEGAEWAGDEVLLLVVSGIVCLFGLGLWLLWLGAAPRLGQPRAWRAPVVICLLMAMLLFFAVAWFWAAKEIREGRSYTAIVLTTGGAWLSVSSVAFAWMGVSVLDDVCERRNAAASVAICG